MTDLTADDLPFPDEPITSANPAAPKPKCRRHDWYTHPEPTPCYGDDGEIYLPPGTIHCSRCFKVKDPAASRRGRLASQRGKRIQRQRIERLGGQNLAGNNPSLDGIGLLFRYESKSGGAFPERLWRWLKGIPVPAGQIGVLIVTDAPGPGHRARSVVVVDYDDWSDLHREGAA